MVMPKRTSRADASNVHYPPLVLIDVNGPVLSFGPSLITALITAAASVKQTSGLRANV